MIRRPPRSTLDRSSAASDVYKRQDRGNVTRKLGKGEQIRISALNEAWVHVVEALNNGAYEAVIQRLVTSAAVIKWAVVTLSLIHISEPTRPY